MCRFWPLICKRKYCGNFQAILKRSSAQLFVSSSFLIDLLTSAPATIWNTRWRENLGPWWNETTTPALQRESLFYLKSQLVCIFFPFHEVVRYLMQMDKVPLIMFLAERPLYNSLLISSNSASCFYYPFWNSCFIVDQLFDPTDISLKCSFPSLTWLDFLLLHQLFAFLFLHLIYGVEKRVTYSVFLLSFSIATTSAIQ